MFQNILESIFGNAGLTIRVGVFVMAFTAMVFSLMPKRFRQDLLSQDLDGQRMAFLGAGLLFVTFFLAWPAAIVAVAGMAGMLLVVGVLVLVDDRISNVILQPVAAIVYVPLTVGAYLLGPGYGSFELTLNSYILQFTLPVLLVATLVSMAVFAGLSESFKLRIMPQDGGGMWFVIAGVISVGFTMLTANPLAGIGLAAVSAMYLVMGTLILLPDSITREVLRTFMSPVYYCVALASLALLLI